MFMEGVLWATHRCDHVVLAGTTTERVPNNQERDSFTGSVTYVRACEPEPRAATRGPIFASHCFFFLFIYFYLFVFWRTWQKKHKFFLSCVKLGTSSFRCLLKVSFRYEYEWNFELPSQIFVSKSWLCKIDYPNIHRETFKWGEF